MDRKLLIISIFFIVAFVLFSGFIVFREPIGRFTRAANITSRPSAQTSLIFAWPLTVKADGQSKSEVTVFVRDSDGRGLAEKPINLTASIGNIDTPRAITDATGKAVFNITSTTTGVAKIEALVDNVNLQRSLTVKFE